MVPVINLTATERTASETGLYQTVLPTKDHRAMLRATCTTYTEEIDGRIVVSTPKTPSDLLSVATASVWTDTHSARTGTSTLGSERDTLEQDINLCQHVTPSDR
jgi:hypothetical protein